MIEEIEMKSNMTNTTAILILALVFLVMVLKSCEADAAQPEWHMVNVNYETQGDAHLLIDNGVNSLVDAGQPAQAEKYLVPYLEARNINVIHHFWVSHPHTDHYGGLDALLSAGIVVENVYYNMPPVGVSDWDYKPEEFTATMSRAEALGAKLHDISKGFTLSGPTTKFTVIHAQKDRKVNGQNIDVNDYSIIMQWDAGEFRTLFTGDLNEKLGTELSKLEYVKADILKIPHHGVTGIAPNSFFDAVQPSVSMIPSTYTLWMHPRGAQAKTWVQSYSEYYCNNGLNGHVKLSFSSKINMTSNFPSQYCPNGLLPISPKQKVNMEPDLSFLPAIYFLLEVGPFATPPNYDLDL